MGTEVLVPMAIMALSAGGQVYNQRRTEKKQDNTLADSIRNRGRKQGEADALVNKEIASLEGSRSDDERRRRMNDYMTILQRGKQAQHGEALPGIGSAAFQADTAASQAAGDKLATNTAGLEARIDAPSMQRQGEAFSAGHLSTDIGRIAREDRGNAYLDELRLRAIRRNPWIDAASKVGMAYGGAALGSAATAAGGTSTSVMNPITGQMMYGG